jgi:hypothetical protein
MPFARKPRKTTIAREMTIRFPVDDHRRFVDFVVGAGLMHEESGAPRLAEAARVLLTSIALSGQPTAVRVAAALCRNSSMLLYGMLAQVPNQLRASIMTAAAASSNLRQADLEAFKDAVATRRRGGRSKLAHGDVERLHLTLDGWLLDWAGRRLQHDGHEENAVPALRSILLGGLVDEHRRTLVAYEKAIDRIRSALLTSIQVGTEAIRKAVAEV